MYNYGTYCKRPAGVFCWVLKDHLSMQYKETIMRLIRFYFLVDAFDSFLYVIYFLSVSEHRRVMFMSSGFMCLLDLPTQMI